MATSKVKFQPKTKLNIVIPVFNEAVTFPKTYAAIEQYVKTPYEVSVVYDFDKDTTVPVAKRLQKQGKPIKLLKNNLGRGPLNALKVGFSSVKSGPLLVVMADLSDDLGVVDKMIELYEQGNDIICASRYMKKGKQVGGPLFKRILSTLAGVSLYYLRGVPTHDITNNFRLYDSEWLKKLTIESTKGFSVAMEITVKVFISGGKITEVPATWHDRTEGKSNFKLWAWLPQYLRWYFYAFRPRKKAND